MDGFRILINNKKKRRKMIWEKMALFFVVIMAIFGACFISIIVHEYTHYYDFKNFNATDQRLCAFVLPTGPRLANWSDYLWSPAGYYGFSINNNSMSPEELANYNKAEKDTEVHAYTTGALVFVFYLICYMIITFGRYKDKKKISLYKIALDDRDEYINKLEEYLKSEKQQIL